MATRGINYPGAGSPSTAEGILQQQPFFLRVKNAGCWELERQSLAGRWMGSGGGFSGWRGIADY